MALSGTAATTNGSTKPPSTSAVLGMPGGTGAP